MEENSEEIGRELVKEHYKIGHWYRFGVADTSASMIKYMRVDKFINKKNQPERVFLKGVGFITLNGMLHTPKTNKDEIIIFCWAKHYNEQNIELDEEKVKEIYKSAMENSFKNIFE